MIKYTKEELNGYYRELWMYEGLLKVTTDREQIKFLKEKIKEAYQDIRFLKGNIKILRLCEEKNVETN